MTRLFLNRYFTLFVFPQPSLCPHYRELHCKCWTLLNNFQRIMTLDNEAITKSVVTDETLLELSFPGVNFAREQLQSWRCKVGAGRRRVGHFKSGTDEHVFAQRVRVGVTSHVLRQLRRRKGQWAVQLRVTVTHALDVIRHGRRLNFVLIKQLNETTNLSTVHVALFTQRLFDDLGQSPQALLGRESDTEG